MKKKVDGNCKSPNDANLEHELEQLERDSQNRLDDKIIAVCGGLLGLSIGFINTINFELYIFS